uniref:Tumor necrosis factor receptor superfamily member 6 n=1 Tax=Sphenodon punctatus TaxID=8508 RepID=A0A8D0HPN2_SPHPU
MLQGIPFLLLLLVLDWTGGYPFANYDVSVRESVYNLDVERTISKRNLKCNVDEYLTEENICCKRCENGSVKVSDCTKNMPNTSCTPCTDGKDYIDHPNALTKCRLCRSCDPQHGFEVAENCTIFQNRKCRCKKGFFCHPTQGCEKHCEPCNKCENDIIVKECTQDTDTVCGAKLNWIFPAVIGTSVAILVVVGIGIGVWLYKRGRKRDGFEGGHEKLNEPRRETVSLIHSCADIDLDAHVVDIVEEMTLPEVKKFVRKHNILQPTIDQIIQENAYDSSEQKIHLFLGWYQQNGMKGAYAMLINGLRDMKLCTVADKIEQKMEVVISNSQKNSLSHVTAAEESNVPSGDIEL